MSGSWFVKAGERHFHWAKSPTFECPNAPDGRPIDERVAAAVIYGDDPLVEKARRAADALEIDVAKVLAMLRRAHSGGTRRLEVDGKLTDRCASCGAKMKRLGFRAWIDEPASGGGDLARVATALNNHFGFAPARDTVRTTWHKTKREAEAWARHERERTRVKT